MTTELRDQLHSALGAEYAIERELGGGGMSRLFVATECSLGRKVVIKVLPPELASEVSAARFQREIAVTAKLQHPNILAVLAAGARGGLLYYVMPFVAGDTLRRRLDRDAPLSVMRAVRFARELADALAYAHHHGVLHRDIKPENILLVEDHPLLADFGIARALEAASDRDGLTRTGMALGTVGYMAPEQIVGDSDVDARADVYALAVVAYEMLAGASPFAAPTPREVVAAQFAGRVTPLSAARPEVPRPVSDLIGRALAGAPEARFQTAEEFRDALDALGSAGGFARSRWFDGGVHQRRAVSMLVGAAAFFLAAAVYQLHRSRPRLDTNLLAVAPFSVLHPAHVLWREGMVDVLSRNLDGAGPLRAVSPTIVVRQWPQTQRTDVPTAIALARRTGARLVVTGDLLSTGSDSIRLTARLIDAGTGDVLGGQMEWRDAAARIDQLCDSLTVGVLRELGRTRPIAAVRRSGLSALSVPALKAFLQGEQSYRRAAWDSALAHFERAAALDSTFAPALRRLGLVLSWQRAASDSLSRAYLLRAGAHNRGLALRESLLVAADSLHAALAGPPYASYWSDIRRLFATADYTMRRYPDDPEAWYTLGDAMYHFGYGSVARTTDHRVLEAFDRAIALDSAFAPSYIHAIELAFAVRGTASGRRYVDAYLKLNPTDVDVERIRVVARLTSPSREPARRGGQALASLPLDALHGAWILLRRWPDSAETAVHLARRLAGRRDDPEARLSDPLFAARPTFLALQLAYRGHFRDALRSIGNRDSRLYAVAARVGALPTDTAAALFAQWLRAGSPSARHALWWWASRADTLALSGFRRRADSLARSPTPAEQLAAVYDIAAADAYQSLAKGDSLSALRKLESLPDTLCVSCFLDRFTAAQLLTARGEHERAAAVLDERPAVLLEPFEVRIALERARVAERLRDRARAVSGYNFVGQAWAGSDPELQPLVAEARRALARLQRR